MADVSVDIETGIVKINRLVAVQDCGLVINVRTAESQVYGALIMGVCYALTEEKIFDPTTGRPLNADMEFYKLAGISDIGELIVHMMTGPGYDERGVIGLGEPPVISPGARDLQRGGQRHRCAGAGAAPHTGSGAGRTRERRARLMRSFEYASPTSREDAVNLLAENPGQAVILAGGTDLLSLMKDDVETPARIVSLKAIHRPGWAGLQLDRAAASGPS